jgi:hypothetical protein
MCLSEVILLDSLGLCALNISFQAWPSKGELKSYQPIFPRNDGPFPAVQLPLLGKELLL